MVPLSDVAKQELGLQETIAIDKLISELLESKSQDELAKKVALNVSKFDRKFWLRLATRSDQVEKQEDKQKLSSIADSIMLLLDALVKQTEEQIQRGSVVLQEVMKAGAEEDGQWEMPLKKDREEAMARALKERADKLDEAFLSNAFAYMEKLSKEKEEQWLVPLLQKILQLYAAQKLDDPSAKDENAQLNNLIVSDASSWKETVLKKAEAGEISETSFMKSLQAKMEKVILQLKSGSYAQRVQAEYLKQLQTRAKEAFKELSVKNFKGFGTPP